MIPLLNNHYAVEVPDGAQHIEVRNYGLNDAVEYIHTIEGVKTCGVDDLPPGKWQIVCTSKDVTEDMLANIVCELPVGKRFENYNGDYPVWYHTKKESFRSLLTSKGCDLNKNWLILKKQ